MDEWDGGCAWINGMERVWGWNGGCCKGPPISHFQPPNTVLHQPSIPYVPPPFITNHTPSSFFKHFTFNIFANPLNTVTKVS